MDELTRVSLGRILCGGRFSVMRVGCGHCVRIYVGNVGNLGGVNGKEVELAVDSVVGLLV